jgi:hypothetical protein
MTPKTEKKEKAEAKEPAQTKGQGDRVLLVELSCKDKKCDPCTYPNCQRYARMEPKKKPYETRMTKMFEVRKPVTKAEDTRDRLVLIELSCKDKKCNPCTYPNCQRFASEKMQGKKKAPFKVKVTELQKDTEVKELLAAK